MKGKRIVGLLVGNNNWKIIEALVVRRYYRHKGIGTALVQRFLKKSRNNGNSKVELGSFKGLRTKAFYLGLGFKIDETYRPHDYYNFIYHFRKETK